MILGGCLRALIFLFLIPLSIYRDHDKLEAATLADMMFSGWVVAKRSIRVELYHVYLVAL